MRMRMAKWRNGNGKMQSIEIVAPREVKVKVEGKFLVESKRRREVKRKTTARQIGYANCAKWLLQRAPTNKRAKTSWKRGFCLVPNPFKYWQHCQRGGACTRAGLPCSAHFSIFFLWNRTKKLLAACSCTSDLLFPSVCVAAASLTCPNVSCRPVLRSLGLLMLRNLHKPRQQCWWWQQLLGDFFPHWTEYLFCFSWT